MPPRKYNLRRKTQKTPAPLLTVCESPVVQSQVFTPPSQSHAPMGLPLVQIIDPKVFSNSGKASWMRKLADKGVNGLRFGGFPNMYGDKKTASECGFHELYCKEQGDDLEPLGSHLFTMSLAGFYTASCYLPGFSPLCSVMCSIANIFKTHTKEMVVTLPQLLVASPGGFSPSSFQGEEMSEESFRCFLFLGGYIKVECNNEGTVEERLLENVVKRRGTLTLFPAQLLLRT